MQIKDAMGNDHGRPRDIVGEVRQAFTSTADTAFDVCLENQLVGRSKLPSARELLDTLSYILWRHTQN